MGIALCCTVLAAPLSVSAVQLHYNFPLRPDFVVDAGGTPGAGDPDGSSAVLLEVDTQALQLCPSFARLRGLGAPTEVHLHTGEAGVNGPVAAVFDLPPMEGGFVPCVEVASELIDGILANPKAYYIDLHTAEYPDGAVRNQLDLAMCSLVAWTTGDDGGEGGSTPQPFEGEWVQIRGHYFEGAEVAYTLAREAVVVEEGTQVISEGSVFWDWRFTFDHDDSGDWIFSASVPGVGQCEATMPIVVGDALGAPAQPSEAPLLPNTALARPLEAGSAAVGWIAAALAVALGYIIWRRDHGRPIAIRTRRGLPRCAPSR